MKILAVICVKRSFTELCDLVHNIDSPRKFVLRPGSVVLLKRKIRHCAGIHFSPIWKRGVIAGTVDAKP